MTNSNRKLEDYFIKNVAPAMAAANRFFKTADGKLIIDRLEKVFREEIPKDNTGAVDPHAVLINAGAMLVVQFIKDLAKDRENPNG